LYLLQAINNILESSTESSRYEIHGIALIRAATWKMFTLFTRLIRLSVNVNNQLQ